MVPPSTIQSPTLHQLEAANKLSVQELNVLDPDAYQDSSILCRATITRFDTHNGWWYKACPSCYKQLRTVSHTDELFCPKHNSQIPLPWFKVGLVLEDSTDATNAIIIGKTAEHLFGISCTELVVHRGFTDQQQFPDAILQTRGQVKIFQLRFGTLKSDSNRNDLLIQAAFDDAIPLHESTSQLSDQSLDQQDRENIATRMAPPITPLLPNQSPYTSTTTSPEPSPTKAVPVTKTTYREAVKRALFTLRPSKKARTGSPSYATTQQESGNTYAPQSIEENVSDSDSPIIGLRKKQRTTDSPTPTSEFVLYPL